MKITFDEIPEEGVLSVEFSESEETLNELFKEGLEQDFHFVSPLKGSFRISRCGKTVTIDLNIAGDLSAKCSCCLKEFKFPINGSCHLTLYPEERENGAEILLDEEEIKKSFYFEKTLNLDEIMREEAALFLPFNPKCSESCKGLCPTCGQNLNEMVCDCPKERPNNKFAILKDLKIK